MFRIVVILPLFAFACDSSTTKPNDWMRSYSSMCIEQFGPTSGSVERDLSSAIDLLSGEVNKAACDEVNRHLREATSKLQTLESVRSVVGSGSGQYDPNRKPSGGLEPMAPGSLLNVIPLLGGRCDEEGTLEKLRTARKTALEALNDQRTRCAAHGVSL